MYTCTSRVRNSVGKGNTRNPRKTPNTRNPRNIDPSPARKIPKYSRKPKIQQKSLECLIFKLAPKIKLK